MRFRAARFSFALGVAIAASIPIAASSESPPPQTRSVAGETPFFPNTTKPAKPMHIMSMNMCTDMMLLQLVAKDRVASVTYLAKDAVDAFDPTLDDGVAINHGTAEEIVTQHPDLIVAGDFSTAMTKRIARKVGIPLVEVKSATTFDDIRQNLRQIGQAVGEPERAQALIDRMDSVLNDLATTAPPKPFIVAAWSGDSVPGKATLDNRIIEAAGARNVASLLDTARYNTFGIEELLRAQPDVLMHSRRDPGKPSITGERLEHPVVQRMFAGREITFSNAFYTCGEPQSAEAALDLRRALYAVTGRSR